MKYPLLPYSQLVYDMLQVYPGVYEMACSFSFDPNHLSAPRLEAALERVLAHHPVFELVKRDNGEPYFFSRVYVENGVGRWEVSMNRILGDGQSLLILWEDLVRAYHGLSLEEDAYEAYMQRFVAQQTSNRYLRHKGEMQTKFGKMCCPVRPSTDVSLDAGVVPMAGELLVDLPMSMEMVEQLASQEYVSVDMLVCLAVMLATMDYEHTESAALTWAYVGRENMDEQRIVGSLHKDIPLMITRSSSRKELFRQIRKEMRWGIAHSDYPLTLTAPYSDTWNYAVNVLRQPDLDEVVEQFPLPITPLIAEDNKEKPAYALLDVEIEERDSRLRLRLKYSATHYTETTMQQYAALISKNAEWLLSDFKTY